MNSPLKLFSIKTLVIVVVLGCAGYYFRVPIAFYYDQIDTAVRDRFAPCSKPVTYDIGNFDEKFGVTQAYFLSAIADAEAVWEKPYGKELFTYSADSGRMKINLVYDYRQEAAVKLSGLGITVEDTKASYDSLKAKYDALKIQFAQATAAYESRTKIFEQKYKAYQDLIAYWNARGGAPKKDYDQIQADQPALQAELQSLKAEQVRLNDMVAEINSMVVVLNRMASALRINVDKYNTIGASLGESFEEGLYEYNGGVKTISIFEFKTRAELVRVLAHELGHALGLDHVDDPKAIMYAYNQSKNEVATAADLGALEARCGAKK